MSVDMQDWFDNVDAKDKKYVEAIAKGNVIFFIFFFARSQKLYTPQGSHQQLARKSFCVSILWFL